MAIVKFHRSPYGTVGCTIGLAPHVYVGAYGTDSADALHKAADIASQMQKLVDDNPALSTALSLVPGGTAAFKAISLASKALKYGKPIEDVVRAVGPVAASVVSRILSIF